MRTLMKWGSWEENGYHDSYFYIAAWHVEAGECVSLGDGATAYGGGGCQETFTPWTDTELERARLWLAGRVFEGIKAAELRDVLTPNKVQRGDPVALLVEHKNAVKVNGEKVQGQWTRFPAGTVATVIRADAFGTFYRNGYNKPGRENTSAVCRLPDGGIMKAPLAKLRLAREPMTDSELQARAAELSYGMECKSLLTGHGGWWTANNAGNLMHAKRTAQRQTA
jgi:hypothetical protein